MKDISIGQFSKRTGLSIRALRLYDAEQLLEPSRVDPVTGYRYYTGDQISAGHLIRQLRSCEMPLDQVRIVMREPQRARAELMAHKAHLEQRLADHQQMLESLNALVMERTEDFEVNFKSVSKQPIVLIRKTLDWPTRHESGVIGRSIAALQAAVRPADHAGEPFLMYGCAYGSAYGSTYISTYISTVQSMNDISICDPVNTQYQPHGEIEVTELPATELAYTIHRGSYTTIQATLERLLRGILGQGLSIVGDAREIFLHHPANSGSVEEYRTELAIPVLRPV